MTEATLDITGFYYSLKIDVDDLQEPATVETVTKAAVGKQGDTGGVLVTADFVTGKRPGFLTTLTVDHRGGTPSSRQERPGGNNVKFPPDGTLPSKFYTYSDAGISCRQTDPLRASLSFVWQYYVFREGKLITASGSDLKRTIIKSRDSASIPPNDPLEFQNEDILRWRIVGIGGLVEATCELASDPEAPADAIAQIVEGKIGPRKAIGMMMS